MDDVVHYAVAVREQPEEHGYDEAEYAYQQVDHSQPTDHAPGESHVLLPEAYVGQQTTRNQVNNVFRQVDVHESEQRPLTQEQPYYTDQDDHYPYNPGVRPHHLPSSLL